jgi:hypothetical protein
MTGEIKSFWDLAWYGGIALLLGGQLYLLMTGMLVTRIAHDALVTELRRSLDSVREDRDQWRASAAVTHTLAISVERLSDALQLHNSKRRSA